MSKQQKIQEQQTEDRKQDQNKNRNVDQNINRNSSQHMSVRKRSRPVPETSGNGHFGGKVGYANPPKSSQFQKGQSGNSKGRPKGSKSLDGIIQSTLFADVSVLENGQRITKSTAEIVLLQLARKAMKGDPRATALFFNLLNHKSGTDEQETGDEPLTAEEEALLNKMFDNNYVDAGQTGGFIEDGQIQADSNDE